jgi:hypothetical protein
LNSGVILRILPVTCGEQRFFAELEFARTENKMGQTGVQGFMPHMSGRVTA